MEMSLRSVRLVVAAFKFHEHLRVFARSYSYCSRLGCLEYTFAGGEAKLSGVYSQRPKSTPPTSGREFHDTTEITICTVGLVVVACEFHEHLRVFARSYSYCSRPGCLEYTFAGGEAKLSGVYAQRPKSAPPTSGWEFHETMEIGRTDISKEQLKLLVNELKPQYAQNSYDLVAK